MNIKFTSILISALLAVSANVYANDTSCADEVFQMQDQIFKYGSITSPIDNARFTVVKKPSSDNNGKCFSRGYYFNYFVCTIEWVEGDWGNTFNCAD